MNEEKEKIPGSLLTLAAGVTVTLVSLWVGQNHGLMPEQASEQAPLVDGFFNLMVTIGTALFIVVEGAILLAVIKFRQRNGDNTDAPPIKGNLPLEAFWTAIPTIIVIVVGIYSVEVYRNMGGFEPVGHPMMGHSHPVAEVAMVTESEVNAPIIGESSLQESNLIAQGDFKYGVGANPQYEGVAPDLTVNVTGLQFAWLFNYPDSGVTTGELHVPVGKNVQLNIAAQDVIHSFWVPQFRLKQDAIPGQDTQLRFIATKTGTYPVVCAELCGSYHGAMRTQLIVHTPEEYDAWLAENQIAQQQTEQPVIAVNPAKLEVAEFLAPYGQEIGIDAQAIEQLNSAS